MKNRETLEMKVNTNNEFKKTMVISDAHGDFVDEDAFKRDDVVDA